MTTFGDGTVDYAFGDGVLHHLDLARKLSSDGRARFIEPAQGSFLLRAFRNLAPPLLTLDEHRFDRASIELLERHFKVSIIHETLLRPFLRMLFFNSAWATVAARHLDRLLRRHPFFQPQAWLLLTELRKR